MKTCSSCKHFTLKENTWGVCDWFKTNDFPLLPYWATVRVDSNNISPATRGCRCHEVEEEREEEEEEGEEELTGMLLCPECQVVSPYSTEGFCPNCGRTYDEEVEEVT